MALYKCCIIIIINMLEVRAGPDILEVKPRTSKHYPSVMTVCKEHLLKEL